MSTSMSAGIYIIDAMARPVVIRRLPSAVPPTNVNDNTPIFDSIAIENGD